MFSLPTRAMMDKCIISRLLVCITKRSIKMQLLEFYLCTCKLERKQNKLAESKEITGVQDQTYLSYQQAFYIAQSVYLIFI